MNRPSHRAPRVLLYVFALLAGLVLYILAIPPITYGFVMHDGKGMADRPWLKIYTKPYAFIQEYPPLQAPMEDYWRWWMLKMGYDGLEQNRRVKSRGP